MSARAIRRPLGVGALGLALGLIEAVRDPTRALFAYTAAFDGAVTIALGALLFLAIAHTARARWFVVFRRVAEAIASTMPIFLVLFVPIAAGARHLYPWAQPETLDADGQAWAAHARPWLNVPFFVVRGYVYLAIWSALAFALRRTSHTGDVAPSTAVVARERRVSAVALPVLAVTLTAAAFDWIMSQNPRWSSDMLGVYVFAGAFTGSLASIAIGAWLAWRAGLFPASVGAAHFHALGRLLLVAVIFWAYIGFVQFLIVWMTDLDRESSFYAARVTPGWLGVSVALGIIHFAVPFALLLSRGLKRVPARVALVAAWLLAAHGLDAYWLGVAPLGARPSLLDVGFFLGLGGLCISVGVALFRATPAVPLHDPALAESLRYESP